MHILEVNKMWLPNYDVGALFGLFMGRKPNHYPECLKNYQYWHLFILWKHTKPPTIKYRNFVHFCWLHGLWTLFF